MELLGLGVGTVQQWRDTLLTVTGGIVLDWGPMFRSGDSAMVRFFLWDVKFSGNGFVEGSPEEGDPIMVERVHVFGNPSGMPRTEWVLRWFDGRYSLDLLSGFGWVDSRGGNGRVTITKPWTWDKWNEDYRQAKCKTVDWTSDDDLQALLWGEAVKR